VAVDERVDIGRGRPAGTLIQRDGARVLLAPERQLGFLLANVLLTPRGKQGGRPHTKDGNRDQG
jgi:hypothetical protein